jgi:hypothetical protein
VLVWLRRIAVLGVVLAATGAVVSFVPTPEGDVEVVAAVAVPRPLPPALPLPRLADPAHAIVYMRGYDWRSGRRTLVERWYLPGTAFRERRTVAGRPLTDRSDGVDVDYARGMWRSGPVPGLTGNCARTPARLESGLADGSVTVSGPGEPLLGEPTIMLRQRGKPAVDVWVYPGTHRAVRCRVDELDAVTFDLFWLPATDTNLRQLMAVVPDGFSVVTDRS